MKCVVLILCICSAVLHRCAGQESTTGGFIGLNSLRRKAVLIYNDRESLSELRVLPSMNFSCSGTISSWTFVARKRNGGGRNQYPRFQLWRPNGTDTYEKVYEYYSSRVMTTDNSGLTIAEYVPPALIPFQAGDVLGVYQPGDSGNSRLSVIHVSVPPGFGYVNFIRGTNVAVFDTTASGVSVSYDFPLVAVNATVPQCVQGFLNEEALRIAVDVYVTDNTYNVRTRERQQRIIPGICFTCTGMLTKWIIGAQRTLTRTTNHLQLQIWRQRSQTNNRYDRINFSNLTDLNATDDLNVYEYVPNSPLQFRANDLLGVFQPRRTDTQAVVYYQVGGGPRNFARSNRDLPSSTYVTFGGVDNDVPLVAVEVEINRGSAGGCTEGFISRERLAKEALLIGDFAYTYRQQTIIPDISFTTNGSVVRLTFAAQYRESATQYPELQVWRNMSGTFEKVGNTDNTEPVQTAYLNVYEYVLDPPLPVLAGDVLGIYQPPEDESQVHLTLLEDTGPVNNYWYRDSVTGPLDTFVIDAQTPRMRNMLPLVAVTFEPGGLTLTPGAQESTLAPRLVMVTPTPTTIPGSPLNLAAIMGPTIAVSVLVIFTAVIIVSVAIMIKCSHSKQTFEELYETPDAIGMKENEAYGTNTQTQHIATAANEAYGCRGDIPVVENVAYIPAAVNIPTVQNEAYGRMNGAAVNTDTEEQNEMYDYVNN